jgi:predicted permease
MVVAEVSLALVLLIGAGLMIGHFQALTGEESGFDPNDLLTMRIDLDGTAYVEAEQRSNLLRAIEESLEAVPGVVAVGTTSTNPICCGDWAAAVEIEGREPATDGSRILVTHRYVTPGLHRAMDIALERGRLFTDRDDARSEPVVIVDRRMADHYWPGEDPIGRRIRPGNAEGAPWRTIVGVVETIQDVSDYEDAWYLPFHQSAAARGTDPLHFMLRLEGDPEQVVPVAQRAVWDVAPALAIYDTRMMTEVGDELVAGDRLAAVVAGVFALLGTALAGFGVYGLMAFFVGQQRLEIGTRLALGAEPGDVLRMVLQQALSLTVVGLLAGLLAAVALSRIMAYFVADMGSASITMVAGVMLLLGLATMLATWVPARRAARVDPMLVLRSGS